MFFYLINFLSIIIFDCLVRKKLIFDLKKFIFLGPLVPNNFQFDEYQRGLQSRQRLQLGFGCGGGDHGILAHLSVVCALLHGFRGADVHGEYIWHGVTDDNE